MNSTTNDNLSRKTKDEMLALHQDTILVANLVSKYALNRTVLAAAIKTDTTTSDENWAVWEEQRTIEVKLGNYGYWIYVDGEHVTINLLKKYLDAYL